MAMAKQLIRNLKAGLRRDYRFWREDSADDQTFHAVTRNQKFGVVGLGHDDAVVFLGRVCQRDLAHDLAVDLWPPSRRRFE